MLEELPGTRQHTTDTVGPTEEDPDYILLPLGSVMNLYGYGRYITGTTVLLHYCT